MTQNQIVLTQVYFTIIILLTEIPSGYFADKFSRKLSLTISALLVTCSMFAYIFAQNFWHVIIIETFLAFSIVFKSGSDSAIIYDSLVELDETDNYHKIQGRMQSSWSVAEGLAAILGGFIAAYFSLRAPLYFQFPIIALIVPLSLSLTEPKRHVLEDPDGNLQNILKAIKFTMINQSSLRWLILTEALLGAAGFFMVWFIQPYWESTQINIKWFGILWALLQFNIAFWAFVSHKIKKEQVGQLFLLFIIIQTISYCYLGMYYNLIGVLLIFIFGLIRGLKKPLLMDILNEKAPSELRATVISVQSMVSNLTFSIIAPFLGYTADLYTIQTTFKIASATFAILSLLTLTLYYFSLKSQKTNN